jgi:O-antigen/teichoic acid export membrane protein
MHVSFASLLWYIYSNCDFAIVGKLFGEKSLGYYALAFQLISLPVQKLTANANQVVYPVFCRLRHDPERLRDWYLRLTVLLGFLGMPALAGMALVANDAFALVLGPKWQPAVLSFQLLSVVGILMVYGSTLPPMFNALGRPDVNLRYTAVCTLLYPVAFAICANYWGVTGVCVAWLVLYPILIGALATLTRRLTGVGPVALLWPQRQLVGAVLFMAFVVLGIRFLMQESERPWLRLIMCIVAGAAAYAGVLLAFARHTVLADLRALLRELRGGNSLASRTP